MLALLCRQLQALSLPGSPCVNTALPLALSHPPYSAVYTRGRQLPPGLIPRLTKAADSVGLDFKRQFKLTDNTCGPHPPRRTLVEGVEGELEGSLRSFGRGFTVLEDRLAAEVWASIRAVFGGVRG